MNQPVHQPPLDWPDYTIGMVDAVKRGFAKFARFDGRASRAEFWWWYLALIIMIMVPVMIGGGIVSLTAGGSGDSVNPIGVIFFVLAGLVWLAIIVPTLALGARRLHDTGQSAGMLLLLLIPSVGGLIVLILCAQATSPRAAQYGPPHPPGLPPGGYGMPYPPQQHPPGPYPPGPHPPAR